MNQEKQPSLRNELIIVVLSIVSVGLLVFEVVADLKPHQQLLIERLDVGIALVFLTDFFWRLKNAQDRRKFMKSCWWELLAAIPITSEVTRALRGLRVLRLLRVLRVVRLAVRLNILTQRARTFNETTNVLTISVTIVTIVLCGALAFHYFEFGVNQNVKSFWDSVWWAIITVTTVGYGDIYPITTGGRIIAIILLVVGLGTFGVYAAAVATWMLNRKSD